MICSANDGELVTDTDEMTDSTRTLVFVQLTRSTDEHKDDSVKDIPRTDGDRVDLALDDDRRVLAAEKVHCLTELGVVYR